MVGHFRVGGSVRFHQAAQETRRRCRVVPSPIRPIRSSLLHVQATLLSLLTEAW